MLADPANEYSNYIKQKIRILDHPKNLIEVLHARFPIGQGLTGNNIKTGPNQYRFTRTFLDREELWFFDLKSTELRHETVANLIIVMNNVVAYFVPKECLSKQKCYIRYNMEKPRKLPTKQYVGLVRDLSSSITQMPPLFDENQKLDESELVDSLAKKAPRIQKAMLFYQGFNSETGYLATFVEHCKRLETTDNIAGAKFAASDEDSDTKTNKKLSKFKEWDENGKKRHKKQSSLYCSLHGENKRHTTRECKLLKTRTKDKDNPKYSTKYYKRKSREVNLLEK